MRWQVVNLSWAYITSLVLTPRFTSSLRSICGFTTLCLIAEGTPNWCGPKAVVGTVYGRG